MLNKLRSLPWVLSLLIIAFIAASPLFFIYKEVQQPAQEMWEFISEEIENPDSLTGENDPSPLQDYVKGSLIMLAGVTILTLIIGVGCAWLVSAFRFRGRALLSVLLCLPIALPTYVMAVMYNELLETSKYSLFLWVRESYSPAAAADFSIYWKFTLAILVLSFSFYPYVFIAARMAFKSQSAAYLESSRVLGRGLSSTFLKISLPLARPSIIAGLTLALLETMNEFGAMKILGIETLTTGIFSAWLDFDELNSAVRISAVMMVLIFILLLFERLLRGRRKYHAHRSSAAEFHGFTPRKLTTTFIWIVCLGVSFMAFILPVSKLVQQAALALPDRDLQPYLSLVMSSSWLAARACFLIIIAAVLLAYTARIIPKWWVHLGTKISLLGYAIPGAILGVVLLSVKGSLHHSADDLAQWIFHSTLTGLIIAYAIRFLAVGYNPIEAGFKKINPNLDEASRSLGKNRLSTLFRIHLPLLRHSFLAAAVILFVDVMKELPLTLILGPSNNDTLATKTYGLFAAEERIPEGSIPALILVITSLLGLLILSTIFNKKRS
ncbi:MAG: iron(III) transport system permease protein [Cryomorphaceae bacterium]|jgi:iron(III) transport system permease protein